LKAAIDNAADGAENLDDFDRIAQGIAQLAFTCFSGALLRRALEIAAAIADFADEFEGRG